jgi:hypothetical protein
VSTTEVATEAKPASPSAPPRFERGFYTRAAVITVLVLLVLILLPQILSLYYIDAMTQVAVYAIVALGLGVLVGRVGLISLGQAAVLAIGAWVPPGCSSPRRCPSSSSSSRPVSSRWPWAPSSACRPCACAGSTSPSSP